MVCTTDLSQFSALVPSPTMIVSVSKSGNASADANISWMNILYNY